MRERERERIKRSIKRRQKRRNGEWSRRKDIGKYSGMVTQ